MIVEREGVRPIRRGRIAVSSPRTEVWKAAAFGVTSFLLYFILFEFEGEILDVSIRGRWLFIVPVGIALAVPFVHGAFTATFWRVLGISGIKNGGDR
jgi:hypothetical protein